MQWNSSSVLRSTRARSTLGSGPAGPRGNFHWHAGTRSVRCCRSHPPALAGRRKCVVLLAARAWLRGVATASSGVRRPSAAAGGAELAVLAALSLAGSLCPPQAKWHKPALLVPCWHHPDFIIRLRPLALCAHLAQPHCGTPSLAYWDHARFSVWGLEFGVRLHSDRSEPGGPLAEFSMFTP